MYVSKNIKRVVVKSNSFIKIITPWIIVGVNLNMYRYYDFLALFKMISLLKVRLCNQSIKYFIHSFVHSFIHPFTHSFIHLLIHSSNCNFIHSYQCLFFICCWKCVCYLFLEYYHNIFIVLFGLFLCSFFVVVFVFLVFFFFFFFFYISCNRIR